MTIRLDIPVDLPPDALFYRLKLAAYRTRPLAITLTAHSTLERDEDAYLGLAVCWDLPANVVPASVATWCAVQEDLFRRLLSYYQGGGKWLDPVSNDSRPPWGEMQALTQALSDALDCGTIQRRYKAHDWLTVDTATLLRQVDEVDGTLGSWALGQQREAADSGAILDPQDLIDTAKGRLFCYLDTGFVGHGEDGRITMKQWTERDTLRRVLDLD